jgi:hypothetical protein
MQLIGASKTHSFIGGLFIHSYSSESRHPARGTPRPAPVSAPRSGCRFGPNDAGSDGPLHNEKTVVGQGIGYQPVARRYGQQHRLAQFHCKQASEALGAARCELASSRNQVVRTACRSSRLTAISDTERDTTMRLLRHHRTAALTDDGSSRPAPPQYSTLGRA